MTNKSLTINEQFNFSLTGLQIKEQPTFNEWQEAGKHLKYVESAINWWLGDWLNYGELYWDEMYTQALDETDYKEGTLKNIKSVAGKIEFTRRRGNLSYSHHVEIASLEPALQTKLLDLAETEGLTVRELRQKVKAIKMQNDDNNNDEYRRLVNIVINSISILNDNYPTGIIEIKIYLEDLNEHKT